MRSHCLSFPFRCYRPMLILVGSILSTMAVAQEIPLGTWRAHISYRSVISLSVTPEKIFAANASGILILDRADESFETYDKVNGGISNVGITNIAYDASSQQLIVTYDNGKFDLIKNNTLKTFDPTANAQIAGSKKINHIITHQSLAYLSTDYGVVLIDLVRGEVKETWRDLGETGETLRIVQATINGDSIFLATANGILAGDLDDNLLDFNAWRRFDNGVMNTTVESITTFNNQVYAAIDGSGLYVYNNGVWTISGFLPGLAYTALSSTPDHLFVTESSNIWQLNITNDLLQIADDKIVQPTIVSEDTNGTLWIGDNENGLLSNEQGTFNRYLPNGPSTNDPFRLKYAFGKIYLLPGGYSSTFQPLRKPGIVNTFSNGLWEQTTSTVTDLVDIAVSVSGDVYTASFGLGVERKSTDQSVVRYNPGNSTLVNTNPPGDFTTISAIENSRDGIWVANYGTPTSLHLKNNDDTWEDFSFAASAARYPLDLVVDYLGQVWMVLNPSQGGGIQVFDRVSNTDHYLTDVNNAGELPSKLVRSIAVDRDGMVWVGTDLGVCYFFAADQDGIRPIFENRFLLRDDRVTAIAVDGGNRKWMGTERGVWLFDPTGEKLIYNFTTDNSPLLSNVIRDIEIQSETGEVFIATQRGLVSFRADATESNSRFGQIKIFPNPVVSTFTGSVGISGLATDAAVKITDISGKLIWQTKANGGTASWNVKDYNGRRASTGVYIVYSATADGSEHAVGKIAVVN
jgi:ligand-binding sensor domain-containing protein